MKNAFATPLLVRLAPKVGVRIHIEPTYRYAGQIILPGGKKRYFRGTNFDLNPLGASEIAKDKSYAAYFLRRLGYRTIKGQSFFSKEWCKTIESKRGADAAFRYARKLGFPVIVKPNSLSQGAGVCLVHDKKEFFRAVREIEKKDRVFLVQQVAYGRDYRIVVLDREVLSCYERLPLMVTGNGRFSIAALIKQKQRLFKKQGRDTIIKQDDFRIPLHLKHLGLTLQTVIPTGTRVALLDNRNLSTGGDAIDMTATIHPSFRKLAVTIVHDMGLRYCGVDLMVKEDIQKPLRDYQIIEINAAPGIDNYARTGPTQKKNVERMYLKVLKAMSNI